MKQTHQITSLKKPNPPTSDAIKRAQFVDKTYQWAGSELNLRSRN